MLGYSLTGPMRTINTVGLFSWTQGNGLMDSHGFEVRCLKQMPHKDSTRLRHGRQSGVRWLGGRHWPCHSEGIIRNG
jgi:hypothetical protein